MVLVKVEEVANVVLLSVLYRADVNLLGLDDDIVTDVQLFADLRESIGFDFNDFVDVFNQKLQVVGRVKTFVLDQLGASLG